MRKVCSIKIIYKCNLSCSFCSCWEWKKDPYLATKDNIVKSLNDYFEKGYDTVSFLWWEPTLHPLIREFISIAKDIGFKDIHIVTNGIKLEDKQFLNDMIKNGLNLITLSLHFLNTKKYSFLTKQFNAVKNIILNKDNIKNLEINTVIQKDNIDYLLPLYDKLLRIGVRSFSLSMCAIDGNVKWKEDEIIVDPSIVISQVEKLFDLTNGCKARIILKWFPYCKIDNKYWKNFDSYDLIQDTVFKVWEKNMTTNIALTWSDYFICRDCVFKKDNTCRFPAEKYNEFFKCFWVDNKDLSNKVKEEEDTLEEDLNWIKNDLLKTDYNSIEKKLLNHLEKQPKSLKILSGLGRLYLSSWNYDKWIEIIEKANKVSEGKDPSILFRLGSLYFEKWELKKSLDYLLWAKKVTPKNHWQYEDLLKNINKLKNWNTKDL